MQKYCYYFILLMIQNTLFAQNYVDSLRVFVMLNNECEVRSRFDKFNEDVKFEIPSICPIIPKNGNSITSFFGKRIHPVTGKYDFHAALDISANEFEDVFATARGMVIRSAFDNYLGNYIQIEHPNGYETLYGHLSSIVVEVGEMLNVGQKIGLIGKSGRATGPHLHYGIKKNGQFINPFPYIDLLGNYILNRRQAIR